jgi:LacI family transcriptional regulator
VPRNFVKPKKRLDARRLIEERIREQSLWGERLMSEPKLAADLGVSRGTLRGALAELEAAGLIERRKGSGTFVVERAPRASRSRTTRLAVIIKHHAEQDPGWTYNGELIRGVLSQAPRHRAECTLLSMDDPEVPGRVRDRRYMRGFDGFICVAVTDRGLLQHLVDLRRGPVVLLDHFARDLPVIGVMDGSFRGARSVVRHLLALGHRRIAFLDFADRQEQNPERFEGYRVALAARHLPLEDELVAELAAADWYKDREGTVDAAVEQMLGLADPPTAFFGFNDRIALAIMRSLEARGLRVGRDVSVAGFGDAVIRRGRCDRLTSCRGYPRKMGCEALRAALAGGVSDRGQTLIVPNRLIIRGSTCPPSAAAADSGREGENA